jgi:hypothetical protein
LTPRTPRLTASRHGFLARSTALSWPWNKDRILAAPGTLPPSFADLALGLVDRSKPVIRVWCKDPMQREDDEQGVGRPGPITTQDLMQRERTGPLRNGNPRGNPNLAPRCGARTRRTGCPCRAPAMRNGRCRLHGGKSTGPRTEEGRARIRAARTRHGRYSAEGRAFQSGITGLLRRSRELLTLARQPGPVDAAALRHLIPPEFGKHLMQPERNEKRPSQTTMVPSSSPPHWGGEGRGEVGNPQKLRTPPPRSKPPQSRPDRPPCLPHLTPTLSAPQGAHGGQRGSLDPGHRSIALSREHLMQREQPVPAQTPGAAPLTTPARRPILLSRPTPFAT